MPFDKTVTKLANRAETSWADINDFLEHADLSNNEEMQEYLEMMRQFQTQNIVQENAVSLSHDWIRSSITDIK